MRIGELAALAGVSTRTVRHYHRVGLLPEPERRPNGYREYGMREAVELVRVRRLVELGLGLDEVRDVISADAGRDLPEILAELDADLARQQEAIRQRRVLVADLLARAEAAGGLPPEGPVSAELAALFADLARTAARRPGPEPVLAGKDRELLALLEASAGPGHREWLASLTSALSGGPEATARAYDLYDRFDDLAEADPDDPRVEELAEAFADSLPQIQAPPAAPSGTGLGADSFADALFADFPPAQARVLRRAAQLTKERGRP